MNLQIASALFWIPVATGIGVRTVYLVRRRRDPRPDVLMRDSDSAQDIFSGRKPGAEVTYGQSQQAVPTEVDGRLDPLDSGPWTLTADVAPSGVADGESGEQALE